MNRHDTRHANEPERSTGKPGDGALPAWAGVLVLGLIAAVIVCAIVFGSPRKCATNGNFLNNPPECSTHHERLAPL